VTDLRSTTPRADREKFRFCWIRAVPFLIPPLS
jgi:hypothetical protein